MICPMSMGNSTAFPCKRDGGEKGSACAWWDGQRNQCAVMTVAGTLTGIEIIMGALADMEQLRKILESTQKSSVLEKLKEIAAAPENYSSLWYGDPENEEAEDLDAPGADHASDIPLEDGYEHPSDEEAELQNPDAKGEE